MLIDSFPIIIVGIYCPFDTPLFPDYKVNLHNISFNFQSKDGFYIISDINILYIHPNFRWKVVIIFLFTDGLFLLRFFDFDLVDARL